MTSLTELGTPLYLAIPEDPPMSADEDVVNLHGQITQITEPCPVMQIRVLVSRVRNLQFLGPCKVRGKEAIFAAGISSQTMRFSVSCEIKFCIVLGLSPIDSGCIMRFALEGLPQQTLKPTSPPSACLGETP